MALERFITGRLVVLHPDATAYQASRAMAENGIGTVLVGNRWGLVGIVTDRDLALRVVGFGLDGRSTPVDAIMTAGVVTLPFDASLEEVARTMCNHGVRRIALMDAAGWPIGIVTLDGLLACGMLPADSVGDIVSSQLSPVLGDNLPGGMGPTLVPGTGRASRHEAHATATYSRFLHLVMDHTDLRRITSADRVARIVVGDLCRRVRPDLARHFVAQLPLLLREAVGDCLDGPDRRVTREAIEEHIAGVLRVPRDRAAEILHGTVRALERTVTPGQLRGLAEQLGRDLRALFGIAWKESAIYAETAF